MIPADTLGRCEVEAGGQFAFERLLAMEVKPSRSGGRCDRQRFGRYKVRRQAYTSPASSQPRFSAGQLGIDPSTINMLFVCKLN